MSWLIGLMRPCVADIIIKEGRRELSGRSSSFLLVPPRLVLAIKLAVVVVLVRVRLVVD